MRRLVAGTATQAQIWDARTGRRVAVLDLHGAGPWGVAWSPDGTRIALATDDGTTRV